MFRGLPPPPLILKGAKQGGGEREKCKNLPKCSPAAYILVRLYGVLIYYKYDVLYKYRALQTIFLRFHTPQILFLIEIDEFL